MAHSSNTICRRIILRGLGVSVSLPWLEAMGPQNAWAEDAAPQSVAPNRMAFLYVPNGKNMADWTPKQEGENFDLPAILEPLAGVKNKCLVLSGLAADKARPHGDGGGDHARALSAFLTGTQAYKTDGNNIRAGMSVDQAAAARTGDLTRLASLEIGCEAGALSKLSFRVAGVGELCSKPRGFLRFAQSSPGHPIRTSGSTTH